MLRKVWRGTLEMVLSCRPACDAALLPAAALLVLSPCCHHCMRLQGCQQDGLPCQLLSSFQRRQRRRWRQQVLSMHSCVMNAPASMGMPGLSRMPVAPCCSSSTGQSAERRACCVVRHHARASNCTKSCHSGWPCAGHISMPQSGRTGSWKARTNASPFRVHLIPSQGCDLGAA